MHDITIIGGGPGGVAAGVYSARKKLKTLVIAESFGGQSVVSDSIGNWIGHKEISGVELARSLEEHLRAQEDIEIRAPEKVEKVEKANNHFLVATNKGAYESRALIIATGARHRRLGVPGEDRLDGRGVSYCSTCDAPLFRDKKVAVIGGGNSGLEAVVDLFPYAQEIFLIIKGETLKGDPITQEKVKKSPQTTIIYNAETQEILGDKLVEGIRYLDTKENKEKEIAVDGVFVEIGMVPNSEFLGDLVEKNKYGEIIVDPKTQATSQPGIFAAGDVTDGLYKQNNIAVGDGAKAALSAYAYLKSQEK